MAQALLSGGLPCAEITFRTAAAVAGAISAIVRDFPQLPVGASTVLTIAQVQKTVEAGARFIVSPGFGPLWQTQKRSAV